MSASERRLRIVPQQPIPETLAGPSTPSDPIHADSMMTAVAALGYARVEYFGMRDAIKGIIQEFNVTSLAEEKKVVDQRPTIKDVRALEQKATQMIFKINSLKEMVKEKAVAVTHYRSLLEAADEDLVLMGSICEVPSQKQMNSNLYKVGITHSEVFKAETFRKFMKVTLIYT